MNPPKRYPLTVVTWKDACSTDPWTSVDDLEAKPMFCTTIGFLISKPKADCLLLASTLSDEGDACCVMHIPTGCVVAVRHLRGRK
jgi:hypothetical protein